MHTGTGNHQITDTRKSGKRFLMSAHCHAQTGDLGDSSGHEGCFCIVAQTNTIGYSSRHSDDVLECTSQFNPNQIVIDINAKIRFISQSCT